MKDERKLPTTDDWLKELWETCIDRSSDEARQFLSFIYKIYQAAIDIAGPVLGASIGAFVGSVVPIVGTVIGAGIGAGIGAFYSGKTKNNQN